MRGLFTKEEEKPVNTYQDNLDKEYTMERRRLQLGERKVGLFKLLFEVAKGRKATEEETLEARKLQSAFFEENPYRIFPDANIFEPIIGPLKGKQATFWQSAGLRVIESAISNDARLARYKM
jgi:hypothetical protein